MLIPTRPKRPRPAKADPVNGDQLLQDVSHFIARYLECSEHQHTVLALWSLHTYCAPAAPITPYLSIQSVEKQSGKSLCLQLLNMLCDSPAFSIGFTASSLTRRIDGPVSTVLLDDCHATFGTRARSKGPALRAILASGFSLGPGYTDAQHERNTFSPKAFAGRGGLPEELADRAIPILLKPLTDESKIERFCLPRAVEEAGPLQERLYMFSEQITDELATRRAYAAKDFPDGLSPRRRDLIEPLLHLADYIGGNWPARIRVALINLFQEESTFDLQQSVQLLADIHDCFVLHNYPEGISTSALLAWLHSKPRRPWDIDGPITARTIARLLDPFEIYPRVQRVGSSEPARGYQLQDFVEAWQTYLGFDLKVEEPELVLQPEMVPDTAEDVASSKRAGKELLVTDNYPSEIANKDRGCNAVTHFGVIPVPVQPNPAPPASPF